MFATFNAPADFTFSTFNAPVDFDGTVFNDSANFAGSTFNYSGDLNGPDTFKQIITSDEKTCDLFRKFYKNEARYDDADNIYYDYQKFAQDNNDLSLFLLSDFLSWITCGYGVRLSHTIGCIVGILVVFSFLYWGASRFYRLLDASEKKSKVSRLEPILISIRAFTTLGSADWYSKNYLFRILVAVEGLLGWIMLGIFMATLTNLLMRS